jgi:parvulin-like peptidyl-prolyl isomerase
MVANFAFVRICLAQDKEDRIPSSSIAVRINSHAITEEQVFSLLLQKYPKHRQIVQKLKSASPYAKNKERVLDFFAQNYPSHLEEVVQELVVQWIIRQEYKKEGIKIDMDMALEKAKQELAKTKEEVKDWAKYLQAQGITDKDYKKELLKKCRYTLALHALLRLFSLRETHIEARHIMVDSPEKTRAILERLKKGEEFTSLAYQKSLSITRNQGGKLPPIYKGDFPQSVEEVLFYLKPYNLSEVVKSPWGYHIFQVLEVHPGNPQITWEQVKEEITKSLTENRIASPDFHRWLRRMHQKYTIQKQF